VRAARDDVAHQLARTDPQALADRGGQSLGWMVEGQAEFGQSEHQRPVARDRPFANYSGAMS
jgi:hypothetical protein